MKILLAGEWQAEIHEAAWALGLRALGHTVIPFGWFERFIGGRTLASRLLSRLQNRSLVGPLVLGLNRDLTRLTETEHPDVLLLYRATHVFPETIRHLQRRNPQLLVATYNNDDPRSSRAAKGLWRHYLQTVRFADVNLGYRQKSVDDLRTSGARGVHLVRSAFLPGKDRPLELTADDHRRFDCDVVFAGHFEDDGRTEYLRHIAEQDFDFRLFGPDWDRAPAAPWLAKLAPIQPLRGEEYVKSIQCSRIALCFLSALNNDTYTRRCFEIPAIGTLLLCQRSADMEDLLRPGAEADYFGNPNELAAKLHQYLTNDELRKEVALAGQRKVHEAGHDIVSRMREVERILVDAIDSKRHFRPDTH